MLCNKYAFALLQDANLNISAAALVRDCSLAALAEVMADVVNRVHLRLLC